MKYLFIDDFKFERRLEINKNYFGLAFVLIDSTKYNKFKNGLDSFLKRVDWPLEIEFKGRYFFDGKGLKDKNQEIWKLRHEKIRDGISIFFNKEIFSGVNKKISIFYFYTKGEKNFENYKKVLLCGVSKCLNKKMSNEAAKNYCAIFADSENSISHESLKNIFVNLKTRASIFENNLNFVFSSNLSPGIQLADIFAYFAQWYLSDDYEIKLNPNLFDNKNILLKKNTMSLVEKWLRSIEPTCDEI